MVPLDLCRLHSDFPDFDPEPLARSDGETAHRLHLPPLELGRRFDWAELRLPNGFPDKALARIALPPDTVLRIPHIESGGYLCTQGDPGPDSGLDPNDRVLSLLIAYQDEFLVPWQLGQLDADFAKEPLSYWDIYCQQNRSKRDPVRRIYTVNRPSEVPRLGEGVLLRGSRWIVAGDRSTSEVNRVIKTLSAPKEQQTVVRIAEIPISSPLTPRTWPKTEEALDNVLRSHLPNRGYTEFHEPKRRNVRCYRLVLFRHPEYSFGYLMPGGPPVKLYEHRHKKTYPAPSRVLPLPVSRFDPEWTVGRDQVPAVSLRREQHVVVLEVLRQQPGCSSRFQSYTAVAAGFAVAMVAEQALDILDNGIIAPQVVSWVRGQPYLDKHYPGLTHRDWVSGSTSQDSWIQTRPFP